MSEDDVDMLGADGSGRVDRDRRAPRFSWTPAYEATFFRSLCESVQLGLRENSSFKAEAWERAAQALQESHGAYPTKNHLINKSDNARKRFRLWRGLREDPDFVYNPKARTVTATEDAWRSHIEREPLSRALRGRPFDHEDYMETLYPDVIGSGGAPKRIMKPKRRGDGQMADESDMPGTGIINLQSEQSSSQQGQESPSNPASNPASVTSTPISRPSGPTLPSLPKPTVPMQPTALTPPDETVTQTRKRAQGDLDSSVSMQNTPSRTELDQLSSSSPEKRLRTSLGDEMVTTFRSAPTLNSSALPSVSPTPQDASSGSQITPPPQPAPATRTTTTNTATAAANAALSASSAQPTSTSSGKVVGDLVDLLATRNVRQWREEAVDLFFRDFASEELGLQVKVTQDMFSNDHTAMVFCKMPAPVREHWIKVMRDAHLSRV